MTETENLLDHLIEECAEVIQRVTKAKKFGLTEIQPEQPFTNAERIAYELADVFGVAEVMYRKNIIPSIDPERVLAKKTKIDKYQQLSRERGILKS